MRRGRTRLPFVGRRTVRRRHPTPAAWFAMGAGKVLLGVAPVAAVGAWLAAAPVFDLNPAIVVETGPRLSEEWVRDRLADLVGRNLPTLPLQDAALRLDDEWVREAKLLRRLPNRLDVRIVEHEPAAVFESGHRSWIIDREGSAIAACERAADLCDGSAAEGSGNDLIRVSIQSALLGLEEAGLPSTTGPLGRVEESPARNSGVTGPASRDASRVVFARTLERAIDVSSVARSFDWGRDVVAVRILSDDDYLLERVGRPATVLVRGSDLAAKGRLFELLQASIREHGDPEVVDLRFRDRIVLSTEAPGGGRSVDDVKAGDPS